MESFESRQCRNQQQKASIICDRRPSDPTAQKDYGDSCDGRRTQAGAGGQGRCAILNHVLLLLAAPTAPDLTCNPDLPIDHDEGAGPSASGPPTKKKRKLPHERLYLEALPASQRYSKSLMHKSQLAFVTVTPHTDFLITSSVDGVVKFWKKMITKDVAQDVEFVKQYRAHKEEITGVSASSDGRSFATAAADNTIKIFDVVSFGAYRNLSSMLTCLILY